MKVVVLHLDQDGFEELHEAIADRRAPMVRVSTEALRKLLMDHGALLSIPGLQTRQYRERVRLED